MPKRFITERDIAAYAAQGVKELVIEPDMVLTDMARERARAARICLLRSEEVTATASSVKPADTHAQVRAAVIARLGSEPEGLDALIKAILAKLS